MQHLHPTAEEIFQALALRHGTAVQERFSSACVAVCGLGGLGSHIANALTRAGVGKLLLIDHDRVELSNIHRQQYNLDQVGLYKTEALVQNLQKIHPYLNFCPHTERITPNNLVSLLQDADVICEAFDQAEAKAMLVNGVLEQLPHAYLVAASGMAGLHPANTIQTRCITSHFFLCGDGISDVADHRSLVSSRVMLCAAHQAHTVLRILADDLQF